MVALGFVLEESVLGFTCSLNDKMSNIASQGFVLRVVLIVAFFSVSAKV